MGVKGNSKISGYSESNRSKNKARRIAKAEKFKAMKTAKLERLIDARTASYKMACKALRRKLPSTKSNGFFSWFNLMKEECIRKSRANKVANQLPTNNKKKDKLTRALNV